MRTTAVRSRPHPYEFGRCILTRRCRRQGAGSGSAGLRFGFSDVTVGGRIRPVDQPVAQRFLLAVHIGKYAIRS